MAGNRENGLDVLEIRRLAIASVQTSVFNIVCHDAPVCWNSYRQPFCVTLFAILRKHSALEWKLTQL